MTNFKLLSVAAILSTAIVTPVFDSKLSRNLAMRPFTRAWVLDLMMA
jgi:hypothetical protein